MPYFQRVAETATMIISVANTTALITNQTRVTTIDGMPIGGDSGGTVFRDLGSRNGSFLGVLTGIRPSVWYFTPLESFSTHFVPRTNMN